MVSQQVTCARTRAARVLLVLVLSLFLAACGRESEPEGPPVPEEVIAGVLEDLPADWGITTPEELLEMQPFLVDVREPSEYATGYIEGAVNIPVRELAQHLDALPTMEEEIVIVCCSGARSTIAMTALRALGYSNVHVLTGGMTGWRSESLPVVGGPGPALTAGSEPTIDADSLAAVDRYLANGLADDWGVIKATELGEQLADDPPFLLDVRQPDEFAGTRIEGTLNIPLRELAQHLDLIPRDRLVTVVDSSGHRSMIGMAALQMLGYQTVTSLSGGMVLWAASGEGEEEFFAMQEVLNLYLDEPLPDWGLISADAALEMAPFWLDVRQLEAYQSGFIQGAVSIPLPELTQHLGALPGQDQPVVIVSDSTADSAIGMMALQLLGYRDVYSLDGGVGGWLAAGLELVSEPVPLLAEGAPPEVDAEIVQAVEQFLAQGLSDGLMDVPEFLRALEEELPGLAVTVVDVRDPDEFDLGSLEEAVNLPLANLFRDFDQIPVEPLRTS